VKDGEGPSRTPPEQGERDAEVPAPQVDLAAQAIRLTRLRESAEPEVAGLLALMLLHHARRDARRDRDGALVTLDEQDRSRGHTDEIAEGVRILTAALAQERPGEYQVQAAIAALHEDAATAAETDWVQILAWYDDLLALTGNPLVALNRAVAVGRSTGRRPGCGRSTGSTRPWVSTTGSTPCTRTCWSGPARRGPRVVPARGAADDQHRRAGPPHQEGGAGPVETRGPVISAGRPRPGRAVAAGTGPGGRRPGGRPRSPPRRPGPPSARP
jgi:hypothetical protein